MNTYPIHITNTVTEEQLQKGTFIFIYRASKIPPHIGIITNGLLYDITSVGPNIDLPISDFYRTAVKRNTEVLFIELKSSKVQNLNKIITEKVKNHKKVSLDTSCLVPVKEFISEVYNVDVNETNFIFELLPALYKVNLINNVWELNLAKKIKNQTFEMKKYTKQDVANCVAALNRKEQFSC